MRKNCILFFILPLLTSCVSVSNGYFAKEPDFFLYPNQSILFTVQTGDLHEQAQFEKVLSDFFINKGYSQSYSLTELDPLGQISDSEKLSSYLKQHDIVYVISIQLTNSDTNYDYVPQTVHTNIYNYSGYTVSNSYTTGGYYTSSTINTFSVTVFNPEGKHFALFEVKSDDSLNLFDDNKKLFEKIAQNIFENLTPQIEPEDKNKEITIHKIKSTIS